MFAKFVEQINTQIKDCQTKFEQITKLKKSENKIDIYNIVEAYSDIFKKIIEIETDDNMLKQFVKNIKNMNSKFAKEAAFGQQFSEIMNKSLESKKIQDEFAKDLIETMYGSTMNLIEKKYYGEADYSKKTSTQLKPFSEFLKTLDDVVPVAPGKKADTKKAGAEPKADNKQAAILQKLKQKTALEKAEQEAEVI